MTLLPVSELFQSQLIYHACIGEMRKRLLYMSVKQKQSKKESDNGRKCKVREKSTAN